MPSPIQTVAPARVNLLGEHTDYTGGLVFPMAIPFHTRATITHASTPAQDNRYTFSSDLFPTVRSMTLDDRSAAIGTDAEHDWSDYPVGVLRELQQLGIEPPPFALHLTGNVPFGSGLSSSASVEVASCLALLALSGQTLPPADIATLCRRAENNYVHSPCGIMDQFVITNARAGHALLLDTRSLDFELVPMNTGDLAGTCIVVCNSMVRHSVATGDYGQRRRELEAGQTVILTRFPQLRDLGDANLEHLAACEQDMSAESFRRCRHIISDNGRVRKAAAAMHAGNADALGILMIEGHASERDDFECSIDEIDFLVDAAIGLRGCCGARLTGGGFGGCTVNLVATEHADTFAASLKRNYKQAFGNDAETYICAAADGAIALQSQDFPPLRS